MNLFTEGISLEGDKFVINMNTDNVDDIIFVNLSDIFISKIADYTYAFGYKFNDTVDSETRTRFIKWLRDAKFDCELESFILKPVKHLYRALAIDEIDCVIYPVSQRSRLVNNIISILNYVLPKGTVKKSVELVKNLPSNIDKANEELYKSILSGNILIIDDINTTGSTLSEIIKTIHAINSDCNIYIFTIIGK